MLATARRPILPCLADTQIPAVSPRIQALMFVVSLLLMPTAARAQSAEEELTGELASDGPSGAVAPEPRSKYEASLVGGIGGFTGTLSTATDVGPVWGLEVDVPLSGIFHLELGYRGFEFPITDTRVIAQSIWAHGARASMKLSVPYTRTVSPFVSVGAGFLFLDPTDDADALFREDGAFEVPTSIGIQFETEFLEASIRGGWSGLFGQSVADEERTGVLKGGVLSTGLSLGIRL